MSHSNTSTPPDSGTGGLQLFSNILFPTDLSETSTKAFEYALNLADHINGRITLLHAYYLPPVSEGVVPEDFLKAMREDKIKTAEKEIQAYRDLAKKQGFPLDSLEVVYEQGYPDDVIVEQANKLQASLVMMGTMGAESVDEMIVGSTTSKVIKTSKVPVLAIPSSASFKPVRHILFATDFQPGDLPVIKTLLQIANQADGRVSCVHVRREWDAWDKLDLGWMDALRKIEPDESKLKLYMLNHPDIVEGIRKFAEEGEGDLLVMMAQRRFLMDRIYNQSLTRHLAVYGQMPLLAFPPDSFEEA